MKLSFSQTIATLSLAGAVSSAALAEVSLQYEAGKDTIANWIAPSIVLSNSATDDVNLENIVVEYYFVGGSEYEVSSSDYTSTIWYSNAQDQSGINLDISFVPEAFSPMLKDVRSNFKATASFSDANYIPAGGEFKLNYAIRKTDWELINNEYDYSYIDSDDYVANSNIIVRDTQSGEVLWGSDLEGRFQTFWQGGYDGYEFFERSGDEILATDDDGFVTTIENIGYNREDIPEENYAFLVKTNRAGDVVWETELKDLNTSTIAATDNGFLVVGAKETYTNDLDPWQWDLQSAFEVIQVSEQGDVINSYSIPTNKRAEINKVIQTRDGGYLVLFNQFDAPMYDGVYGHAISNGALLKLNADLSMAWINTYEADSYHTDIDILFPNRIIISGAKRVISTDERGNRHYSYAGAYLKEVDAFGNLITQRDYPQVEFGEIKYQQVNVELGDTKSGSLMLASNVYGSSRSALSTRLLKINEYSLNVVDETLLTGEDAFEVQDLIAIRNRDGNQSYTHHIIICGDNKLARMEFNGPLWSASYEGAEDESYIPYSDLRGVAETRDGGFVLTGHQVFGEEQSAWILKVGNKGESL